MPEAREAKCSFIICDEYFGPILPLERIDIDATEKEQKRFPKSHPAHQGQGSVYPPPLNKEAQHIKERARIDKDFCLTIASLIFPRVAILRNDIVKFITPKTDDYFKLTGYSSTKKDNRERVEKALQDYHFIFPVVWKKAAAAADGASGDAANPKLEANPPFHSGPIIDTINEKFFSKPRCLGRKYKKLFKGPDSHPNEFELPDTMVALVAVYPDYMAGQVAVTLTPAGTPKHALKQRTTTKNKHTGADQAPVAALITGSAMKVLQLGVADEDALV
ncbi:hypothetical protein R3P38DRAFT_3205637 [Favolaschia claudopus]|uniref:DUF6532 domain-containing protein n=1 Tax=Favolaschia claudopus TaxID=2862362 RepID=A0AAW0APB4_9AGAR